jgi:hypothetical protein
VPPNRQSILSSNTKIESFDEPKHHQSGWELIFWVELISMTNNVFNNSVYLKLRLEAQMCASVITGSSFQQAVQIKNIQNMKIPLTTLQWLMSLLYPLFKYTTSDDIKQKPTRMVLYLATDFKVIDSFR